MKVVKIKVTLKPLNRMHVGSGRRAENPLIDVPIVRYSNGEPYIPGSTLKGRIRSIYQARFGEATDLFGDANIPSRIFFDDLQPSGTVETGTTYGIAIERETMSVREGALYAYEYIEPGSVSFTGFVTIENPSSEEVDRIVECLRLLDVYPLGKGSFFKAEVEVLEV